MRGNKYIVLGMGFGDEGKGMVTDYLSNKLDSGTPGLVVRFNGGHQAGHTVFKSLTEKHVFSSFGSGSFRNIPTVISKDCVLYPKGLLREYDILKKLTIPTLYIDSKCPVTTIFDIMYNGGVEIKLHGTCGVGIFATLERERNFYSLLAEDLKYPAIVEEKLHNICNYYKKKTSIFDNMDCKQLIKNSLASYSRLLSISFFTITNTENFITCMESNSDYGLIYEGAQGLLLDQHAGFFPHCTPSNTGLKNIQDVAKDAEIFLVSRVYMTRHGAGPVPGTISIDHILPKNEFETNVTNEFQGEFKRYAMNFDLYKYALKKHNINIHNCNLVLTHVNQGNTGFMYYKNNELITLPTLDEFIKVLKSELGTPRKIFISDSPLSSSIKQYKQNKYGSYSI